MGDDDGVAVWTVLTDPREVQEAILRRAEQRREEEREHDKFVRQALRGGGKSPKTGEDLAAAATVGRDSDAGGSNRQGLTAGRPSRLARFLAMARRVRRRRRDKQDARQDGAGSGSVGGASPGAVAAASGNAMSGRL